MTAHAMKGDEARCLQAGMDAYISKPIEPAKLFEIIETVVCSSPHPAEPLKDPGEDGRASEEQWRPDRGRTEIGSRS
jgi:DNA-binding response OmpR family regulator